MARARSTLDRVELVVVGDELLSGRVTDTNSALIGRSLSRIGAVPIRIVTVRDDEQEIRDALAAALARAQFVIVMGGLGPTSDDRTTAAVAAQLGRGLVLNRPALSRIRAFFHRRGLPMPELSKQQAQVIRGARLVTNPCGMVPGMIVEQGSASVALMPGVPVEMEAILERGVLPYLRRRFRLRRWAVQTVRTFGIAESAIAERVMALVRKHQSVLWAYYPSTGGVDVVLSGASGQAVSACVAGLGRLFGSAVYECGDEPLEAVVGRLLLKRRLWLATAESCTGGLVSDRITNVPGSSAYFRGGVAVYANDAKQRLLGVSADILKRHGAVSEQVVRAMVTGVTRRLDADAGIAVTGIAGPGGGTRSKPVGLVYVAALVRRRVAVEKHRFSGTRRMIKERSASAALDLLRRLLQGRL